MGILDDLFGGALPGIEGVDPNNPNIQAALLRLLQSARDPGRTAMPGINVVGEPAPTGTAAYAAAGRNLVPPRPTAAPAEAAPEEIPTTNIPPRVQPGTAYRAPAATDVPADVGPRNQGTEPPVNNGLPANQRPPARITPGQANPDAPPAQLDLLSRAMGILLGTPAQAGDYLPGGGRDQQMGARNATYQWLTSQAGGGHQHNEAMAILANPATLAVALQQRLGPRGAPQIVEREGPFGQKIREYWNAQTGRFHPAEELSSTPGTTVPGTTAPGQGAVVPPLGITAPGTGPVVPPVTPSTGPVVPPVTPGTGTVVPPAATTGTVAPNTAATHDVPEGAVLRPNPSTVAPPTGYVHRQAANGQFLYHPDGRPWFEPKSEMDARAKAAETRAGNRVTSEEQLAGVSRVIADARRLPESPGFAGGLALSRYGMNIPWGIGNINPIVAAARTGDPTNPDYSMADRVATIQEQLSLLVARPLMRGQGQVTNSERAMIRQAIGNLSTAGSEAMFQFRLNSVEAMLTAMNSGERGAVTAAAGRTHEPTVAEISGIMRGEFSSERLETLARRYNVSPTALHDYAFDLEGRANDRLRNPRGRGPNEPR